MVVGEPIVGPDHADITTIVGFCRNWNNRV